MGADGGGDDPPARLGVAQISRHQRGVDAQRLQSVHVPGDQRQSSTVNGELACDRSAESSAGAGHHDRRTGEGTFRHAQPTLVATMSAPLWTTSLLTVADFLP